jgi:hypothetical protein
MENSRPLHGDFYVFDSYWGQLVDDPEGTRIFGFESCSVERDSMATVPGGGACFGYVQSGWVDTRFGSRGVGAAVRMYGGTWFTTEDAWVGRLSERCRVAVFQRLGHSGVDSMGIVRAGGDLRYIDGCRDSVLSGPRVVGMPVLNALFVPPGVHQTMHTHPSVRAGIIMFGNDGVCETPTKVHPLKSGSIFYLPTNGLHKFLTDRSPDSSISLVAYHPDSDFGPSHEQHPMLNRTIVDGVSANSPELASIRTRPE